MFVELCLPVGEFALFDGFAHFGHDGLVEMQVVDGVQLRAQNFAGAVQVVQVGAAEMRTGVAGAGFVERAGVVFVLGVFDFDVAETGEQPAVAGVAGGHDAVEHVHAVRHAVHQVFRCADAHQVMRFVFGQYGADGAQHAVHFGLGFADGQAADGEAGEVELFQPAQGLFAQVFVHCALHDAEQGIGVFEVFKGFFAAFRPAQAHLQRFFGLLARGFAGGAFVELHGDVGVEHGLDFHGDFGREEEFVAVNRAFEGAAFFGEFAHVG